MVKTQSRIKREKKTIESMIKIYCNHFHKNFNGLCQDCQILQKYAFTRLDSCRFQENKPTCLKCSIHCYKEPMKTEIKRVMRYSGPRMLIRHPILSFYHIFDKFKKAKNK